MTRGTSLAPPSTSTAASTWRKPFEIRLFGEPEFRSDNQQVTLKLARPRCIELLALCLLNAPRPLARAAICAHLWPDFSEEESRANLRRHLSELNTALEPYGEHLLADRQSVRWNDRSTAFVDVLEFEKLAARGDQLEAALALYRADLMPTNYEDWLFAPRERLRTTALQAAHTLGHRALEERDFARALEYAQRALALSEWREDSLRLLMTAMYAMGNRPGALAAFDRFSTLLVREMNVEPMAETIALRDTILAGEALPEARSLAPLPLDVEDDAPFVGRDEDVQSLRAAWDRATRKSGNTIFIGGEAGIGKTRLVREFARYVRSQNGAILWGHASPDSTTPYLPLVDLVKSGIASISPGSVDPLWIAIVGEAVPELARTHTGASIPDIEQRNAAPRLREAFARVLEAIVGDDPALIVIEDLHWSDSDTIEAIAHLARRVRAGKTLLLLTHRSEETPLSHPLRGLRRTLVSENRALVQTLARLDRAAIATAFGDDVALASDGNPLFALQIVAHRKERGETVDPANARMHSIIAQRLAHLQPASHTVLNIAALIDESFTVEEITEIAALSESEMLAALDLLLDARLVKWTTRPGFSLTFSHQLLRDVALATMPSDSLALIHLRIATVLESTRNTDPSAAAVIARHYELARRGDRAYELYLDRAANAIAISAPASALEFARSALRVASDPVKRFNALRIALRAHLFAAEITNAYATDVAAYVAAAEELDDEDSRFEALAAKADYLTHAVDTENLRNTISELLYRARASKRKDWLASAHERAGMAAFFAGNVREAIRAYTEALVLLPADSVEALRVRAHRISMFIRAGDLERGHQELDAVDKLAQGLNDHVVEGRLGTAYQTLAIVREEPALFRAAGERLIAFGERAGALNALAVGQSMLLHEAYLTGDVTLGRELKRSLERFHAAHDMRLNNLSIKINAGWCERTIGNVAIAIAAWEDALREAERVGRKSSIATALVNLAESHLLLGDFELALQRAGRAHEIASATGEQRLASEAGLILGAAKASLGEDVGLAIMRGALDQRRDHVSPRVLAESLCIVLETYERRKRLAEASADAAELRSLYVNNRDQMRQASRICYALARYEEIAGDGEAAKRYIFEGVTVLDAMLKRIPDDETRANIAALPHNQRLQERDPGRVSSS